MAGDRLPGLAALRHHAFPDTPRTRERPEHVHAPLSTELWWRLQRRRSCKQGRKRRLDAFAVRTSRSQGARPVKRTQDDRWALNLAAARRFLAREGHLRVPRKHAEELEAVEVPTDRQDGAGGPVVVKLGTWLDNVRKRADKLHAERRAELDTLGMRW
ncbi:helicase associated domain-containing protein [Streptomyces sp. NPDC051992]|uniref:helicase associated domain-containing protein n=1 Tax=Streptomyces sp. NPDC051992 TaxID=3161012 RepID=UPI003442278E